MRTNLLCGIAVLALLGAGCSAAQIHELHPEYAHSGARDLDYEGAGLALDGRHAGDPSGVIAASSEAYATRVDADGRLRLAQAEARLVEARARVTEARASRVDDILGEVVACQHRGYDLRSCAGDVATLYLLTSEQQDALFAFYGFGGLGMGGGFVPSASGDTASGTTATAMSGLRSEVSALAGDVDALARALGDYAATADAADGGAR